MTELAIKPAYDPKAPGRWDVLVACAAQYKKGKFNPNDTNALAVESGRSETTVGNTIDGYGPEYNAQRKEGERYSGMICITEPTQDGLRSFVPENCTASCSSYPDCPLRAAIEAGKSPERRYTSGNLTVIPRNGVIIPEQTQIPAGADFGLVFAEQINQKYALLAPEIEDLLATGNLGKFEFCESQMRMDKISRKVMLTHPEFPGVVFNFAIGEVLHNQPWDVYHLNLPNTALTTKEVFPNSGSNIIDQKTGRIISNNVIECVGAYDYDVLERKVEMTREATRRIGTQVKIPDVVAYGHYSGLAKEKLGFFIYTSPEDLSIINDYYMDVLMQLSPNTVAEHIPTSFGQRRDELQNQLIEIDSKVTDLVSSPIFSEAYRALAGLFRSIKLMHERGIVHLQLHSGNWGITPDGQIYIGDWETASVRHIDRFAKAFDLGNAINRNLQGFINGIVLDSYGANLSSQLFIGKILQRFIEEGFAIAFQAYGDQFDRNQYRRLFAKNYLSVASNNPRRDDRYYAREAASMTYFEMKLDPDRMHETISKYLARSTPSIESSKKPERNAPCPCGSGKKYKQCCGSKR